MRLPDRFLARDVRLDLLRFFAISLVVLAHCLRYGVTGFLATPAFVFIALAEIPLFAFVSGIFHLREEQARKWYLFAFDLLKKAIFYLYPIITYAMLRTYVYAQYKDFPQAFYQFMDYPAEGLWFLWVLFWTVFFFDIGIYMAGKLKNKAMKFLLPAIVWAITWAVMLICYYSGVTDGHFLGVELYLHYSPFYLLGYAASFLRGRGHWARQGFQRAKWPLFILALLVWLVASAQVSDALEVAKYDWCHHILGYLGSAASVYACFVLVFSLPLSRFSRILSAGGRWTLEVYWIHPNLLRSLPWFSQQAGLLGILSGVLLFIVIMAICYGLCAALLFIPFSHFLVFGKSESIYGFERQVFHPRFLKRRFGKALRQG